MARYSPAIELIQLMAALQGTSVGLTIDQLRERFDISRRTAERRLHAVAEAFPDDLVEQKLDDGRKHWRLRGGRVTSLLRAEPAELAALDTAVQLIERDGRPDQAVALQALADKMRALARPDARPALDTDASALLEGQGVAMRPGPHPIIPQEVLEVLREAVLACREVEIAYRSRVRQRESVRTVRPYGFLFGGRHYLIAHDLESDEVRMFSLPDIASVRMSDEYFERPEDFDLGAHAARSFGVWQEEPVDVVWRFTGTAARDALEYQFHPSQQVEEQPDGSVLVRFHAGGLWEMAFHLVTWRDQVEIIEPESLRATLVELLETVLATHRRDG